MWDWNTGNIAIIITSHTLVHYIYNILSTILENAMLDWLVELLNIIDYIKPIQPNCSQQRI